VRWTHSTRIDAPADVVWQLTTDVEAWPATTPTMQSVKRLDDGPLRVDSQARIKQPGQAEAVWTVTRLEPGHEFSWESRRRGLVLTGTHTVTADGSNCRNTLVLDATGPLAAPLGLVFGAVFRRVLRTENAGFKAAAERPVSGAA
jgi:uncharacterized membrane protein